jgi:hypothetical protein
MPPKFSQLPGQPYNQGMSSLPNPSQPISASQMKRRRGPGSTLVVVLLILLLIGSLVFGLWTFVQKTDLENNIDTKVQAGLEKAVNSALAEQELEFKEREKEPLKSYKGPTSYGAVEIKYPKTWSALIDESGTGNTPVIGYFNPGFIPALRSKVAIALKIEILEQDYNKSTEIYTRNASSGKVTVKAIKAQNVKGETGVRIDGEIGVGVKGTVVLFPLRDKTLRLTVESEKFIADFDKFILPNLKYSP